MRPRSILLAGLFLVALIVGLALLLRGRASAPDPALAELDDELAALFGEEQQEDLSGLDLAQICERLSKGGNHYFGEGWRARCAERLAAAEAGDDAKELTRALLVLAQAHLTMGENEEGIALLERALERVEGGAGGGDPFHVRFALAVAWLRSGETTHCLSDHNPERCLFPITGEGVWDHTEPADRAVELLEACLAERPDSSAARWLLNVANMARGSFPEGVDPALRLPLHEAPPEAHAPRFRDVAKELGVDVFDLAGGALMEDLDGDGLLDLVSTSMDPCGQMRYFHNEGDGSFADWTERAGLVGQLGGLNLAQADYDGDGRLDLFVFRGAWLGRTLGAHPNALLRQRADGGFDDVSEPSGVAAERFPCATGSWQDWDRDGDLDVFVGGELCRSQLLRNEGDGTFVDVAEEVGLDNDGLCKGGAWGDYDGDGDADLYVSNLGHSNRLYRNEGDGTLVDVAEELGVDLARDTAGGSLTFACWFFDYDNDGWLDLYVGGFGTGLEGYARDYLGLSSSGHRLHLFRNGGGSFRSVAEETGLARVSLPMGANYGDVDNDGFPDLYLGTGKPGYEFLVPNTLHLSLPAEGGGRRFADVTASARVGHLQKGHGIAFGDLDNDGDQDIFAQMGGFYRADAFHNALFVNEGAPGTPSRWVTLVLRDEGSANRFGVGARVRVDVRDAAGRSRSIHSLAGSGGSFGASSLQQELGLGDAAAIERVEVVWPDDGERQVLEDVPLDAFVEVRRGASEPRVLERPRLRLPSG